MDRTYTGPLLDKLGVRPGMRVALIEIDDGEIRSLLAERTSDITEGWPLPDTDVVLLGADATDALAPLESLSGRIRSNGAIWVVSRKGKTSTLRDVEVIATAKAAGLVDNKVVSLCSLNTGALEHRWDGDDGDDGDGDRCVDNRCVGTQVGAACPSACPSR